MVYNKYFNEQLRHFSWNIKSNLYNFRKMIDKFIKFSYIEHKLTTFIREELVLD